MNPARIVGRVAEILHAVRSQLCFLARVQIAHPEIVIFDIRLARAVGRDHAERIRLKLGFGIFGNAEFG